MYIFFFWIIKNWLHTNVRAIKKPNRLFIILCKRLKCVARVSRYLTLSDNRVSRVGLVTNSCRYSVDISTLLDPTFAAIYLSRVVNVSNANNYNWPRRFEFSVRTMSFDGLQFYIIFFSIAKYFNCIDYYNDTRPTWSPAAAAAAAAALRYRTVYWLYFYD